MLYFVGWVLFIVALIAAVPIGSWLDKRKLKPQEQILEEEPDDLEPAEQFVAEEEVVAEETDLEKRIRRLRIISENMSQEEMFAHAQATLELATMLQTEDRLDDADRALEILTSQPGIGDRYRTRALSKHSVVLKALGRNDEFADSQAALHEVYENFKSEDPEAAASVIGELTPEESELLSRA